MFPAPYIDLSGIRGVAQPTGVQWALPAACCIVGVKPHPQHHSLYCWQFSSQECRLPELTVAPAAEYAVRMCALAASRQLLQTRLVQHPLVRLRAYPARDSRPAAVQLAVINSSQAVMAVCADETTPSSGLGSISGTGQQACGSTASSNC